MRDVLIPLLFGISIGYFLGVSFLYKSERDIDEHIHIVPHNDAATTKEGFSLRCVIVIHPDASKPEQILHALNDGYTKLCNETLYYTRNERFYKKYKANYSLTYLDSSSNHFYWSFYQQVMEFSSRVPSQWTFIGDDQTYLIVPNLQRTLRNFDPDNSIMIGRVKDTRSFLSYVFPFSSTQKVSVRAGVVLSNSAIDRLAMCRGFLLPRSTESALYSCSSEYGVRIVDPFDEDNSSLLHDMPLRELISPTGFFDQLFTTTPTVKNCCSDHSISFGQMSMKDMRVLDYGMHMKVFGRAGYIRVDDVKAEKITNDTALI